MLLPAVQSIILLYASPVVHMLQQPAQRRSAPQLIEGACSILVVSHGLQLVPMSIGCRYPFFSWPVSEVLEGLAKQPVHPVTSFYTSYHPG